MKITFEQTKPLPKPVVFPAFFELIDSNTVCARNSGMVVMFTEAHSGIVLFCPSGGSYKIGEIKDTFTTCIDNPYWKQIHGSVTITD